MKNTSVSSLKVMISFAGLSLFTTGCMAVGSGTKVYYPDGSHTHAPVVEILQAPAKPVKSERVLDVAKPFDVAKTEKDNPEAKLIKLLNGNVDASGNDKAMRDPADILNKEKTGRVVRHHKPVEISMFGTNFLVYDNAKEELQNALLATCHKGKVAASYKTVSNCLAKQTYDVKSLYMHHMRLQDMYASKAQQELDTDLGLDFLKQSVGVAGETTHSNLKVAKALDGFCNKWAQKSDKDPAVACEKTKSNIGAIRDNGANIIMESVVRSSNTLEQVTKRNLEKGVVASGNAFAGGKPIKEEAEEDGFFKNILGNLF